MSKAIADILYCLEIFNLTEEYSSDVIFYCNYKPFKRIVLYVNHSSGNLIVQPRKMWVSF